MRSAADVMARARSPQGQKAIRYTLVSAISVVIGQTLLACFYNVVHWSAAWSNVWAVSISAGPSYYLNRYWAWGKRGRNHLLKEVLPFWGLALLGLAFSTWSVHFAEHRWHGSAVAVQAANLFGFGVLWVAKFVIFNELMFKHHPQDLPPAIDGRTGVPT